MKHIKFLAFALMFGLLFGLWVGKSESFPSFYGVVSPILVVTAGVYGLVVIWDWAGRKTSLAWMMLLALVVRLAVGLGLNLALPVYGYGEPCQQQGYLFKDACRRDAEAFALAQSDAVLLPSSGIELDSDQYGGLAFFSAWIYRYLSPDAHRPLLVLVVGIFCVGMGVPFLYLGVRSRFSNRAALVAGWVFAIYPDAVFFSASQMREPFILGFSALAFWSGLTLRDNHRARLAIMCLSLLIVAFFSPRAALVEAGVLAVWIGLDCGVVSAQKSPWLAWAGLGMGGLLLALFTWGWFTASSRWDVQVTVSASGWMQKIIGEVGEEWTLLIVGVYGLAQPVLPAALTEDAIPLWKGIAIVRSTGWYGLAPLIAYGCFAVRKERFPGRRRRLIWVSLAVAAWLVIASIRAGGDMTDNPRYRLMLLPWIALLVGWTVDRIIQHRERWFAHFVTVEAIFLGFFTQWYASRHLRLGGRLPFWQMAAWIVGLSLLVLLIAVVRGRLWKQAMRPAEAGDKKPER